MQYFGCGLENGEVDVSVVMVDAVRFDEVGG